MRLHDRHLCVLEGKGIASDAIDAITNVSGGKRPVGSSRDQAVAAGDQTKRPAPGRRERSAVSRSCVRFIECMRTSLACPTGTPVAARQVGSPMIERRQAARMQFVQPGVGSLRLVQDVQIARLGSHHAVVIVPRQLQEGERLLLEIWVSHDAKPYTVLVHVVSNQLVMDEGSLRWQARLKMVQPVPRGGFGGVHVGPDRRLIGALIRRVPVRVVEASTAGCVFESPFAVNEGTVGFLQTRTATHDCSEAVRVRRMSETSDSAWAYRMAAEFLTLGPVSLDSLRGLATIMSVGSETTN